MTVLIFYLGSTTQPKNFSESSAVLIASIMNCSLFFVSITALFVQIQIPAPV